MLEYRHTIAIFSAEQTLLGAVRMVDGAMAGADGWVGQIWNNNMELACDSWNIDAGARVRRANDKHAGCRCLLARRPPGPLRANLPRLPLLRARTPGGRWNISGYRYAWRCVLRRSWNVSQRIPMLGKRFIVLTPNHLNYAMHSLFGT